MCDLGIMTKVIPSPDQKQILNLWFNSHYFYSFKSYCSSSENGSICKVDFILYLVLALHINVMVSRKGGGYPSFRTEE